MDNIQEQLREFLLKSYNLDINEAVCYFSTQNYAYIFKDKPYMIRVGIRGNKSRANTLSELLWVDDLKIFSDTICEPSVSTNNLYIEEIVIDGKTYRAAMFRTAKGRVKEENQMDPMYFICVGDLLGRIHAASMDAKKQGLHYQRPVLREKVENYLQISRDCVNPELYSRMQEIAHKYLCLSDNDEMYGMIHGDFHQNNFFVDGNNIWVFDFDECCYGHFMYDIASIFVTWLMFGYKPEKTRKNVLEEDILPYFRIGYNLHMNTSQEQWSQLPLFMELRQFITIAALHQISKSNIVNDMGIMRQFVSYPLLHGNDFLEGLDAALKGKKVKVGFQITKQADSNLLKISITQENSCTHVRMNGKINTETVPFLREQLAQISTDECKEMVFDCTDVSYINSMGLRLLLEIYKKYGKLKIVNASTFVAEILHMTGLKSLLN